VRRFVGGEDLRPGVGGFQLGGIIGHKFLSKYRVGIDLEKNVLSLKQTS
jgi:hypothetical protein